MDPVATLAFARALIDIDSTTGRERAAGGFLADALRARGWTVTEQALERGCANVLATLDTPAVVLSTHYDCVPPFFPSRVEGGLLYGRGACDAKGILAAQLAAAERLRQQGERRVGLLFVVGEERGSDGAALANAHPVGSRFLVNGEPTDSRLGSATRGVLRVRLRATGKACHSAAPEHGLSAIDRLLDALMLLRTVPLPVDPELGKTYYSIGLIDGGVAPNVVSPHASAEVLFRTVGSADDILAAMHPLRGLVAVEEVLRVRPVTLHVPAGMAGAVFPFTTDVPLLDRWGTPLLFGPGSFLVAHTDREHLEIDEMHAAAETYVRLVTRLLD
jgi:acetylornithine deacetylase/succinyl-diaminopimelate desuccinylase-like protein